VLAGFENHGGRTHLGAEAEPLGRVLHGHGNNDQDGYEGVKRLNLIGNVSIEVDLGDGPLVLAGFENHGGRTHLGPQAEPLGRVLHGHGNNDRDGYEGVKRLNLIGTYLHGPLLPKNAWLADRLTALAIERRTGTLPELEPLPDELETASHKSALRAASTG